MLISAFLIGKSEIFINYFLINKKIYFSYFKNADLSIFSLIKRFNFLKNAHVSLFSLKQSLFVYFLGMLK